MKKSLFAVVLCLAAALGMALALTGCSKDYSQVTQALNGVWYANGGSEEKLNVFTFEDETATLNVVDNSVRSRAESTPLLSQASISDDVKRDVKIDDTDIILLDGGKEVSKIPYEMKDGEIILDGGKYVSEADAKSDLLGFWTGKIGTSTLIGSSDVFHTYELTTDTMTYEEATSGYNLPDGQYYYYGPVSMPYKLEKGRLIIDLNGATSASSTTILMASASFNIIDGTPTLLYGTTPLQRTDRMPGKDGYQF
ncbi:MAG: hypothetical protein U0M72_05245 [Eggerthellaceae bacterium]